MTPPASLAFLHGFTGSPASWDPVLERLDPAIPFDCPALAGHRSGAEDAPSADFGAEIRRLAVRWSERLPRPIHLVGYSMGGRVALGLLVDHGELFSSATLVGASPGLTGERERAERRGSDEEKARGIVRDGIDRFVDAWKRLPLFATQERLPAPVRERHDAIRRSHSAEGLSGALRAIGTGSMPSLWPRLASIGRPADLVAGEEDGRYVEIARRMARAWPEAEVRVVPGCGHDVVLEDPGAVARIVAARLCVASRAGRTA